MRFSIPTLAKRRADTLEFVDRVRRPNWLDAFARRALDIAVSAIGLLVSSPILLMACLAVYLSMGRPIFFLQNRPGRGGRTFRLMKFRSMKPEAPGTAQSDGDRLTPFGRFLRKTSIDELPSLFNVLKGDMSIVGPRPLLVRYLERYSPTQARRHEVKPGITGWAQVNGRNAVSWDEKFALDVWYVEHQSLWLDIGILLRTVVTVLGRKGIEAPGHATMPEFMGQDPPEGTS